MVKPESDLCQSLIAARNGSSAALGRLLRGCEGYLLFIAEGALNPMLRAKAGTSDLVQLTLLEATRDFDQFKGATEEALLAWLRKLLIHNLATFHRKYLQTRKCGISCEVSLDEADTLVQGLAAEGPLPEEEAARRENVARLQRALDQLPEEQRTALTLRQEGCSFSEIGARMNRMGSAAQKLWGQAIKRVEALLKRPPS